jgi:hypothetical protein
MGFQPLKLVDLFCLKAEASFGMIAFFSVGRVATAVNSVELCKRFIVLVTLSKNLMFNL